MAIARGFVLTNSSRAKNHHLTKIESKTNKSFLRKNVDDILEVLKETSVDELTYFLNNLDNSGSIKFTYEMESDSKLPFLDLSIVRNELGDVKLQIYRKPTHTDQHLNFCSHYPIEHKLSVMRTLLERSQSLVSDSHGRQLEDAHVEKALRSCGYPE